MPHGRDVEYVLDVFGRVCNLMSSLSLSGKLLSAVQTKRYLGGLYIRYRCGIPRAKHIQYYVSFYKLLL
jgi:hypothetical protein